MMRGFVKFMMLAVLAVCLLAGCKDERQEITPKGESVLEPGKHMLEYTYPYMPDKIIPLYYIIPTGGDVKTMPILFVMHGTDRNADTYLSYWEDVAASKKVMVFAPLFSATDFPASHAYQYAGVSSKNTSFVLKEKAQWTISIIEHMFDFIRDDLENTNTTYDLWGHSAGSQFTHRMMFFLPEARVRMAVASNAGVYLMPDPTGAYAGTGAIYNWPYSLRQTDPPYSTVVASNEHIRRYLAKNMVVHLGTSDTKTSAEDSNVSSNAAAEAQGAYRLARGRFFFNYCSNLAEANGWEFNWTKVEVSGVGHSGSSMTKNSINGAAKLLYPD